MKLFSFQFAIILFITNAFNDGFDWYLTTPLTPSHLFCQQSWCPICRAEILTQSDPNGAGSGSISNRKMSNGWKANLNTAFEEQEDDDEESYEREAMMEASPYVIERREVDCHEDGGEEYDEEETKSCSAYGQEEKEEEQEEEEEYQSSYPLQAIPSVESLMAKQTVDSVMGGVVSQLR
jgi:hypothetical protein